jgi:hypothetical protein
MRKNYIVLLLFLGGVGSAFSQQDFLWKAGLHAFFDNNEFAGSLLRESQTMAGVHIAPEVGLGWEKKHRVFVGADIMREFGSDQLIDYSDLIAYYEYSPVTHKYINTISPPNSREMRLFEENRPFRFYMGAFPRKMVLDKYPRMFFQDSIWNYRPLMTGIFWEKRSSGKYFLNAWLDWTQRQTKERNEAFFVGLSGRYNLGMFYGQFFSYMYHFAAKKEAVVSEGLHDNVLVWTSLGIDLTKNTDLFQKLEINAGWTMGVERDRDIGVFHTPQGFLSEIKVEYKGLGLFNTYYRGRRQQVFYGDHSNNLYWGDPYYRSTEYNRADLYVNFIKTDVVNLRFTYSLHFVERAVVTHHEQLLTATFDLDNFSAKKGDSSRYEYIWDNWFK